MHADDVQWGKINELKTKANLKGSGLCTTFRSKRGENEN